MDPKIQALLDQYKKNGPLTTGQIGSVISPTTQSTSSLPMASTQSTQALIDAFKAGGGQPLSTAQIGAVISPQQSQLASVQSGLPSMTTLPSQPKLEPFKPGALPQLQTYTPGALPQYQQYNPSPLPTLPEPPKAPDLRGFSEALDVAVNLAQTNRNSIIGNQLFAQSSPGVSTASDFNGIINSLNRASTSFINQQTGAVANQFEAAQKSAQDAYNKAYDLSLRQWEEQNSANRFNASNANDYNMKAYDVQNEANKFNASNTNDYNLRSYDIQNGAAQDYYTQQQQQAQQKYEQDYKSSQNERSGLQNLALELAKDGASQEVVNSIVNSGNLDSGVSIASGYLSKKSNNSVSLQKSGDALYQITQDKNGNVVDSKLIFGGGGGGTGAPVTGATGQPYNGEFAATVSLASNVGSTNQQRSQITNNLQQFIASKDYKSAYAQIIQSTSAGLKGEAGTKFQNQVNSLGVLDSLEQAIQSYARAGGNTNIFKGSLDNIQTKIGQLYTDPKYAALATQIDSAFQQYRLNMTGAAFGAQESAEYASVIPGKSNSLDLNTSKLAGAKAYLNSSVESSIKSVVGEGGVYIKEYAQGAGQNSQNSNDPLKINDPLGLF